MEQEQIISTSAAAQCVTVVASDACYPIELRAEGRLLADGTLEIVLPFVEREGVISSHEDGPGFDLAFIVMPDGEERRINDGSVQLRWFTKVFMAHWGTSYVKPGQKPVRFEFFSDALGYGSEERANIDALAVGEEVLLDAGRPQGHPAAGRRRMSQEKAVMQAQSVTETVGALKRDEAAAIQMFGGLVPEERAALAQDLRWLTSVLERESVFHPDVLAAPICVPIASQEQGIAVQAALVRMGCGFFDGRYPLKDLDKDTTQ